MELIDKDALVAEIEKWYSKCLERAKITDYDYWNAKADAYRNVLTILTTSLEVEEVDLEKEIDKWYNNEASKEFENVFYEDIEKCARHFFELGTKTQHNSIGFQNIDDILKEEGIGPDSKEAKVIKEAYFVAIDKAFENFKKGE